MASKAGGIRAGRAFVELFADDKKLVRGLKAAQKRLQAFGASIRAIGARMFAAGASIAAPLTGALTVFAQVGDSLDKMSARTGVSVEALSELGFAAEQSGASLEAVGSALFRMRRRVANAATASGPAVRAIKELGLSAEELTRLSPEDQFLTIADRLKQVKNESLAAQYAFEIFGDGAKSLLPMLAEGADGIEALRQQAREFGLTVSTEDATAAAAFTDALSILTKTMKSALLAIGSALAPMMTNLAERIARVVKTAVDWIRRNQELVLGVFKVAVAVMAGGAALIALGTAIGVTGAALGAIASAVTLFGSVLGALLSPIGLVVAAIVSLGVYLVRTTDIGAQALKWLGEKFQSLKDTALKAWRGIGDALAAGDIALAAKVLWLTLKMQWQKGVDGLNRVWVKVKEFFLSVWTEAVFNASKIATNAWAALQAGWAETIDFLTDAWSLFTTGITQAWHTAVGFIRKAWVKLKSLFDSDLDAEAEITRINQEVAGKNQSADQSRDRRIFEREQSRRRRLEEIESGRAGALGELEQMREAEHAARQQRHSADIEASESALRKARDEWQEAIAEAARKRKQAEAEESGPGRKSPFDPDGLDGLLGEISQRTAGVQGTFNAAAVRGFGSGSPEERTAKASEETAKNTKRLLDEARHGGLVFG